MPPRRSSRAVSATLEPPQTETLPAKRKRGPTAEPDAEKEIVAKPPSRARRSASVQPNVAPSSKGRKSTRSKASLPGVAETENEEQSDAPPPVKKPRPSAETNVVQDVKSEEEEEEEEPIPDVKPKRGKRVASVTKTTRATAMDVDEEPAPQSTGRRASSRKAAVSSGSRTSVGSSRSAPTEEADEESEEEQPKPAKGRRGASKVAGKQPSKTVQESDDDLDAMLAEMDADENDYEEDVKPTRKAAKGKAPARKTKAPPKKATKAAVVESSDEEDVQAPPSAQPRSRAKTAAPDTATVEPPVEEEEEEERSLFDPPTMPAAETLPTTMPEEPAGPKSRLVIHKMALVNFKSYAGRQEIGPFHKSFSSIVGPNGSGKSNTIDALLFVFGYRASKMRQGKISELIHNSADYPDLQECSVEVHFREIIDLPGPDAFKVVPGSQLSVTRFASKGNASRYTINRRPSSYGEVQTLLKGRGIDLDHNRFLILQGEVESIAQMKPKAPSEHEDGLLEYLEDIIGTSGYKKPIDEALVEMERLQEDRQAKMNRLRLVEKEKAALEAKKREAEDYLRLKNEHVRASSRTYQFFLWQALESEKKLSAMMAKLKKDPDADTERHKDDLSHLEMLKGHYETREKAYAEVQVAVATASKDLAAQEKQEVALVERRKHANGKAKKLKKSVTEDTAARKTAANTIEDSMSKIKKQKRALEEHEASLDEAEKTLTRIQDSLRGKTQVFHDQIQVKQKELQPWTAKINNKQAEIDVATSERDALAKKAQALELASKEANATLEALREELQIKAGDQDRLRKEKAQLQGDLKSGQAKLKEAQDKATEWRGKAANSRNKVDEAKASQSENRSRNNVLDSLTRLRDGGNNEGFHGRLGSLGTIPDKYDVAISTACGALSNMIVDKVTQAQSCIEYLRKNNVGRASFMVLEKLNSQGMEKIATPENVPRLFDLVKPKDPKFAPAFFKAIGQTLVADDMDQANRIAFGPRRWRVVTLQGAVIETSGAMSGGGGQPSRGGMSSKLAAEAVSPQVLHTYERDSEQASQQLQRATNELREVESELERLNRRGPEIDLTFQKLGMDVENVKKRIADADRRIKDINSQNKPNAGDLARISKLEKEIGTATDTLEELKDKASKIEQDIKGLENKILEIGGSKLLSQKSTVEGIRLHINLANDEITKAEVARDKAKKDVTKYDNNIETNTASLQEVEEDLAELEEQIATLTTYVTDLRQKVEEAQTAAEHEKDDLETLKAELDEKEEKIGEFRTRESKLKQEIGDTKKLYDDNEASLDHFQNAHDKLQLEEIDEDDEDEDEDEDKDKDKDKDNADGEGEGEQDPSEAGSSEVKVEGEGKAKPGQKSGKKAKDKPPSNELYMYTEPELAKMRKDELLAHVEYLDEKIQNAKPDLTVLAEYKQREQEFMNRAKDLDAITAQRDAQKNEYDMLRKQRLDEFMAGFNLISLKLKEMYQMITLGGNAELELVDSLDPFSEGIIFSVMPPKKSWKNISNLSGGEKTLSSLALVFALHVFKPTPLYFMDEIDAALDFRNVSIVANYIKDRTKNAQFIIISLRNDMFELSHRLIGIYKTSNATRSISIDNHSLQSAIPSHPPSTKAAV